MNPYEITVVDCLGNRFPLSNCGWLCVWHGELDFGEPVALRFPDGETIVAFGDHLTSFQLLDKDENEIDAYDIDWDLSEDDLNEAA